jgi:uncharacterized protein YegL
MEGFMVNHEGEPLTLRVFNSRKRTRRTNYFRPWVIVMGVSKPVSGCMVKIPLFLFLA